MRSERDDDVQILSKGIMVGKGEGEGEDEDGEDEDEVGTIMYDI